MAAVASNVDLVSIEINGVSIQVPKGELIVESVKRLGLEIPIFCYHPRMKAVGMCRMCLVEVGFKQPDGSVRKMPKPQAGCTLPASDGMVVYTDSEMVHRDRKGVLEFLLVNHPLDCPVCDRGGECPLQNNTLFYGPSTSRFLEMKRHLPKAYPLSKYVTLDLERCIQCGRCVRFTEEISGDSQLAFRFRGALMQPSTFELKDFESKFSGNVIEICPVGALTNAEYRFRARPWDLQTKPAICTNCSNGCNVWMDYRGDQMVRINGRTNEQVNEEWTCDKGKFGHEYYNSEKRLTRVLVRNGDALVESDWGTAYEAIRMAFSAGGGQVAALTGPTLSNEDLFMLKRLFGDHFGSTNIESRWTGSGATTGMIHSSIESIEGAEKILVFGGSLAEDLPIVHLRVRKAWFKHGSRVIVASDRPNEADSFAHLILRYKPGTENALAQGLASLVAGHGNSAEISAATGVTKEILEEAAQHIQGSLIITTHALLDASDSDSTVRALQSLGSTFNCFALGANDQGALELGIATVQGVEGILRHCAEGKVEALWLAGCDPFALHPNRGLVEQALENVAFLVVHDHSETTAMGFASVVLPKTAPAEQEGTYMNCEGRVQKMEQVLAARGAAKPAWRSFAELSLRMKPATPPFGADAIFAEIQALHPPFQ